MGHRVTLNTGSGELPNFPVPQGTTPIDPRHFRGYSYLLGEPDDATRTTIGADPAKAREILTALYSLLPMGSNDPNTRIPAGYTYLLQFVAHDLVDTNIPFWAAAEAGVPSRNMRDEPLALDTLYGGGPTICPMAFEPAGMMPDSRIHLRLGQILDADRLGLTGACPYRDTARLKVPNAPPEGEPDDASQVFLADVRNDSSTLLGQIIVLFSIVHNAVATKLATLGPQQRFAHASTAVRTMYYAIIRNDLMKLLLHEPVYNTLNARKADSNDWLWHGRGIPLEFSHGAYRVGHAMVRPFYKFNVDADTFPIASVLQGPIPGEDVRSPLPSTWIVEWANFFALGGTPNYSLKLSIHQQLPLDYPGLFNPVAANSPDHMTLRDWLSAANARTARIDVLIQAAGQHYPDLKFLDGAAIQQWLTEVTQSSLGTADAKTIVTQNAALLATDLPLPLYVLLESQRDSTIVGAHLGPLGSIIVGETIFRRLVTEEAKLASQLPAAKQALGPDWASIQSITSMPDLVRLAEDWGNLKNCPQMPFIAA
jgi:hypothetical protein